MCIRDSEQIGEPRAGTAQIPNVNHGSGQLDVPHAFAPDLGPRDFDPAALADDALETDALVLAAVTLPVLGRAEDLLAEEAVLFGTQRSVVDGLGLLHFSRGPTADVLGRGESNAQFVELVDV